METVNFRAMNTDISLAAEGNPGRLGPAFEAARGFIEECERRFSRFLPESELSQLNRAAGTWFHASDDLLTLVMLSQQYVEQTGGLFDPSILPDLERIGYDRTMDSIRAQGVFNLPGPVLRRPAAFDAVVVRQQEGLICLPRGMALDLGGIAKGWIAEQAALLLSESAPVCGVNAGGDMFLAGIPANRAGWPVALEDPRSPGQNLALLTVPPGAVATSSIMRRAWMQGGLRRHHLIDPRTGEPAECEWLCVTVIAPHAHQAEVFAKALLIAGPQQAQEIAARADVSFLAVDRAGGLVGTLESMEYLYER